MLTSCPTTGKGALVPKGVCVVFTPQDAGADPSGANATLNEYALEPVTPNGGLVVQLNGSLGKPEGQIADPDQNIYNAESEAGYHVIGLAYRSTTVVGQICAGKPACYALARSTIVLGKVAPGGPATLADTQPDEGIVQRLEAALRLLDAAHPNAGWGAFLTGSSDPDPTTHIAWQKVITAGHSQGGGHAAYMGHLFPLKRVVQLSSTCDSLATGEPAPWTAANAVWATTPSTSFVGFAAPTTFTNGVATAGDTTCPNHVAVWQNMGMDPSRMHDDADTCGDTGDTHSESIHCATNYPRWVTLFQ